MLHTDVLQLSRSFENLELHAAHSGREVLRVLRSICLESRSTSLAELANELHENIDFLFAFLPPYAPPLNRINQVLLILEAAQVRGFRIEDVRREIEALGDMAISPRSHHEEIAKHLLPALPREAIIYTHTLSETVLGVLLQFHQMGQIQRLIVTESRPNNDGWVTARRLAEAGVPVELTIDAAIPAAVGTADLMLSGAEIINSDGSVVGKIGAFAAAVLCKWQAKPLYIVADSSKIIAIPWQGLRLTKFNSTTLGLDFEDPAVEVIGSYFDITPANLIRAYATERGLLGEDEIQALAAETEISTWLAARIQGELQHDSPVLKKDK